jgi:hypothetical protein
MKKFRIFVLTFLLAIAVPFVTHYRAWARHSSSTGTQPAGLRIVAPKSGEKLAQTFVTVQYQPLGPAASGSPTFELRLDGLDAVQTTETSYTFNGLTPGFHNVVIQAVDANGSPILRTRSELKFVTLNSGVPSASAPVAELPSAPLPMPRPSDISDSSLPLLSVIGFGILVGGVISALRTRPAHK